MADGEESLASQHVKVGRTAALLPLALDAGLPLKRQALHPNIHSLHPLQLYPMIS